jgi:hypothetical protein
VYRDNLPGFLYSRHSLRRHDYIPVYSFLLYWVRPTLHRYFNFFFNGVLIQIPVGAHPCEAITKVNHLSPLFLETCSSCHDFVSVTPSASAACIKTDHLDDIVHFKCSCTVMHSRESAVSSTDFAVFIAANYSYFHIMLLQLFYFFIMMGRI